MIMRNDDIDNVHLSDSVCSDTPWIGFPQNWGPPIGPAFTVKLDPRVETSRGVDSVRTASRRSSLAEMNQLMEEFADWNDDLLGELAR